MIVSQKRIEANRRNAQKSTGPKTPEGKAVARRNALKHGLTALIVQAEDAERFVDRANDFHPAQRPQNRWQEWLSEGIALITIRIDRVERMERKVREKLAWRAYMFWDEDRRAAVERVAARLRLDPGAVVGELMASPQGCDWLATRWAMLAALADRGAWTDDQRTLAHDLLGTPPEARAAGVGLLVDEMGRRLGPDRTEAEVAREAIAAIQDRRGPVEEADEVDRHLTQADLSDDASAELARLRRYEATLQRRLRWYAQQIQLKPASGPVLNYYKPDFFRKPESLDLALETPVGDPTPRTDNEHNILDRHRQLLADPSTESSTQDVVATQPEAMTEAEVEAVVATEPGNADDLTPATAPAAQASEPGTDPLHDETNPPFVEVKSATWPIRSDCHEKRPTGGGTPPSRPRFPSFDEAEEADGPMDWGDEWVSVPEADRDRYPAFDWATHVANQIRFEREAEAAAAC